MTRAGIVALAVAAILTQACEASKEADATAGGAEADAPFMPQIDPDTLRSLVADYLALAGEGQDAEAVALWCDPARGRAVSSRIAGLGRFSSSVADPLPAAPGEGAAPVSLSFQLLGPGNSNLLDGTAIVTLKSNSDDGGWCIKEIGLQAPPQPI